MANVSYTAQSKAAVRAPRIECYIGGRLRTDALVELVELAAGYRPTSATISFPGKRFPHTPAPLGAEVFIYANRAWNPQPLFRGRVEGINDIYDRPDVVTLRAVDARADLDNDVASSNYNVEESDGDEVVSIDARRAVSDVHRQYATWQASQGRDAIGIDLSMIDPVDIGALNATGNTHGSLIEQIQRTTSSSGRRRTYLKPVARGSQEMLSAFRIGQGPVKNIIYATSNLATIENQPYGRPTANRIERVRGDRQYVTSLIVRSRRRRVQTTFSLSAAWDTSLSATVLENYDKYSKPKVHGVVNPNYNPLAIPVGRRYAIPRVTLTDAVTGASYAAYPKILPELLDNDPSVSATKARPFVVVKWPGDANYYPMMTGFALKQGRWLVFGKPLIRAAVGSGGYIEPVLPESVQLVAAYDTGERLSVQANASSARYYRRQRRLVDEENCVWNSYATDTWKIQSDGTVVSHGPGSDQTNDTARLTRLARARLTEMEEASQGYLITMPYCPVTFRIGDRIALNGRTVPDVAVMRIQYGLGQAFNPSFQPYCQIEVGAGL